jgi:hypothetical protein
MRGQKKELYMPTSENYKYGWFADGLSPRHTVVQEVPDTPASAEVPGVDEIVFTAAQSIIDGHGANSKTIAPPSAEEPPQQ